MASNNAYVGYINLASNATFSASTNSLLLPVSNILVPHVARKWRGNGGTTDYFVADLGSAKSLDTLAVFGITGKQIRLRVSSVDPTGAAGDLYDSGTVTVDQTYLSTIKLITSAVSGRYVRADITTDGTYVEAGRLFVGLRYQFAYNFSKGWQRSWTDRSIKNKTRGGQTQVWNDNSFRSVDITFDFINQTDRDGIVEALDIANGTRTDVLFITNPASSNLSRDSIFGLMTQISPVVQPYIGSFTKQYMIEERL